MVASLMQLYWKWKKYPFLQFLKFTFKKYALRKLLFKLNILFKKIKHFSFMNASQVKIKIVLTNVKMSADITSTSMSMSLSFLREWILLLFHLFKLYFRGPVTERNDHEIITYRWNPFNILAKPNKILIILMAKIMQQQL